MSRVVEVVMPRGDRKRSGNALGPARGILASQTFDNFNSRLDFVIIHYETVICFSTFFFLTTALCTFFKYSITISVRSPSGHTRS